MMCCRFESVYALKVVTQCGFDEEFENLRSYFGQTDSQATNVALKSFNLMQVTNAQLL